MFIYHQSYRGVVGKFRYWWKKRSLIKEGRVIILRQNLTWVQEYSLCLKYDFPDNAIMHYVITHDDMFSASPMIEFETRDDLIMFSLQGFDFEVE